MQKDVPHAGRLHRRGVAHVVAFRRLDLDDVGAEVRDDLGGVRPEYDRREIEHSHASEGAGHSARRHAAGCMLMKMFIS
jgi:hypothetical protein